ncbi:uncharacterized protein LOC117482008 [Trematomus bernacchii]|uniref:uncharacterized protein LOC117482008 n=1 Tax=Trematomus bernacchii TaxID=40690 RepID=UPI00146B69CC|nr:uncharacterized protein LOC117482008 [Trematomus bernacchii]
MGSREQVDAPRIPSLSTLSAEIEEGSSVTLTCSSDANPAANYIWYKEDEDSPKASGQIFTITDFRAEHSGSYSCGAQNKLGRSNSTLHLSVGTGKFSTFTRPDSLCNMKQPKHIQNVSVQGGTSMVSEVDHTDNVIYQSVVRSITFVFMFLGSSTMIVNIIRTTLGVLILIPVFLLSLWMRKKKALRSTTEAPEPEEIELDSVPEYENDSDTAVQTEDTEEQEDLV